MTITATGANFTQSSQIEVAGASIATTYGSATTLTGTIPAAQLASATNLPVAVVTGSQVTTSTAFAVQNPAPTVTGLSPQTINAGSSAASITVTGTNFFPTSTVSVNGSVRSTTYLSTTQMIAALTATDLASAGTLAITVTNASPGGGTSAAASLTIAQNTAATPTLTAVSPTSIIAGSTTTTVTLAGTNFSVGCTVQANGSTVTSTASTAVRYYAYLPTAMLSATGTVSVTITCGGVTSNAQSISITNPPVPTLNATTVQAVAINASSTVVISGTNFTPNTVLQLNGKSLTTTVNSSTTATATIPAGSISLSGPAAITAYTPAPGGGTSNAVSMSPYVALTNNSMVYNPANGLFYLSVPGTAGAPYGNSVVSVDPVTGTLGTPIFVGSDPDRLALSADGSVLWVGLDGGASIAKVLLSSGTVSYTFSTGGNSGVYATPVAPVALLALPGSNDSVIAAGYSSGSFNNPTAIFDHGVARTNNFSTYIGYPSAIQADGTRNEIYGLSSSGYYVFSYTTSGLTSKTNVSGSFAINGDDMQLTGGRVYTDAGKVLDSESGALLGSLYVSGSTLATGPTIADTGLGKIFVLDNTTSYSTGTQIQIFDATAFTTSASVIPVLQASTGSSLTNAAASRLTRWGTNGLAFRNGSGFYSLRSNLVKDLSGTNADLAVAVQASSTGATGASTSYTLTVTNSGPSSATEVALTYTLPTTGPLSSVTTTQGSCAGQTCDLGTVASGGSVTVTVAVQQMSAGTSTLGAQVSASEADPNPANNTASASTTITGSTYSPAPSLTSLTPAAIQTGLASATTVTVTGSNFTSSSVVQLNGTALTTTYVSPTQLTVSVPTSASGTMGWGPLTVTTPGPGGGTTTPLPLSFFQVMAGGLNHMVYDPFSRKIMAAVGSGSSTLTGNSLVAITPETASFGTPVSVGSQPGSLALSSDGSVLYTALMGSQSVARFNMLSQTVDFTFSPAEVAGVTNGPRGIAVQPGNPNTIALDISSWIGIALYDINPTSKTAMIRGAATGPYTGSSIRFLDATNFYSYDSDTSGATFNHYTVSTSGFQYYNYSQYKSSTLLHFGGFAGTFKLNGGLVFANAGGVANPLTDPASQIGYYPSLNSIYTYSSIVEPDTALSRVFFLAGTSSNTSTVDSVVAYDQNTFLPVGTYFLNMASIEGSTTFNPVDLVRWGQDGLAILTSTGHVYLLRGAAVVPSELTTNSGATLSSLSTNSATSGSGNLTLTVTGSGFVRGAGVNWNGSYRTTTWISSTQLSVAIPASDLASSGTATVTVVNPNASASSGLTFTIQ